MLQKGQKTSLIQLEPNLDVVKVGMGWDLGPNGQGYDLDVEAFLLNSSGKVLGDDWFVFYTPFWGTKNRPKLFAQGELETVRGTT